jgi:ribosome assembly protein YihI (activator of Der GTPase)
MMRDEKKTKRRKGESSGERENKNKYIISRR